MDENEAIQYGLVLLEFMILSNLNLIFDEYSVHLKVVIFVILINLAVIDDGLEHKNGDMSNLLLVVMLMEVLL